jgi:hypothetical protein
MLGDEILIDPVNNHFPALVTQHATGRAEVAALQAYTRLSLALAGVRLA